MNIGITWILARDVFKKGESLGGRPVPCQCECGLELGLRGDRSQGKFLEQSNALLWVASLYFGDAEMCLQFRILFNNAPTARKVLA